MIIAECEENGKYTNKYSYDLDSNANSNSVPIPISGIYLSANYSKTQYPDNHNKGIGKVHDESNPYNYDWNTGVKTISDNPWEVQDPVQGSQPASASCKRHTKCYNMEEYCPQQLYNPTELQQRCADVILNSQSTNGDIKEKKEPIQPPFNDNEDENIWESSKPYNYTWDPDRKFATTTRIEDSQQNFLESLRMRCVGAIF